ncbi:26 kDa periplasmic immunogenic protein [Anaerolineae bacterium]|nr:26 kDa periplasmic immunogenic protein [Anaerolineae bacterium]
MRKSVLLVAILLVCVLALPDAPSLRAESHAAPALAARPITTTGEAEIKVAPDEVILILGVETWDKNIQNAKKQNDDRVKKITALTKDFGIDPKHVQTDQINVEPRYRNGLYTDADFIGYFVRKTMVITLKDVSKFEDVFTGALSAGATHVQGVQFCTTELRKYRDQARALAIQAAREKARALAGELGRKIGEPQSIQENQSSWWSSYSARWGGAMTQNVVQNVGSGSAFSEEGTFAPGQISISARVTVTFDLE